MDGTQELFEDGKKKSGLEEPGIFNLEAESTSPKDLIEKIEPIIKKTGISRLVIDSMTGLSFASKSREPEAKQIARYINRLKQMNITTLMLSERFKPEYYGFEHYLCHGLIELVQRPNNKVSESTRALLVLKMSGTKHDNFLHPLSFSDNGLNVHSMLQTQAKSSTTTTPKTQ
jgi:KaiC/GvpD/RAD55 family RecA-like ATPase